jgi:UDP-N-acetylmuramate dehydrogenase
MEKKYDDFIKDFPETETDKNLSALSSMGIGGAADLYLNVKNTESFSDAVKKARESHIPCVILGGGSNVIFADEGFRGLVLRVEARKIELEGKDIIAAEAGAALASVIQFALKNGLTGMENLMGLPGTLGGAVRGNAGAYGTEIKDIFDHALILTNKNQLKEADAKYFNFGYRDSTVKKTNDVILKIWLRLKKDPATTAAATTAAASPTTPGTPAATAAASEKAKKIIIERTGKQPKGKCSGSFFKNPNKELSAGYLLDQCGLKGLQVGGAQVSAEHANWIINRGNATQEDILTLSGIMQEKVFERFNIKLIREVQLIGTAGFLTS